MLNLLPDTFFSFEEYSHASLFDECEQVWEALSFLSSYLHSLPLGNIETDVPSSAHLIHPAQIYIGPRTIIEPGAYIEGPCFIDSDCQIRQGAYIRGRVITGKHCVIGHATEIKNSILFHHCSLAHFNYVGDSILGNRVNLGAGSKCANLRLDRETVKVSFQGKKIDTKLGKFGAVIGDDAQLGCNCVTNPGTIIGKKVICYPCLNIGGLIPSHSTVKPSQPSLIVG